MSHYTTSKFSDNDSPGELRQWYTSVDLRREFQLTGIWEIPVFQIGFFRLTHQMFLATRSR